MGSFQRKNYRIMPVLDQQELAPEVGLTARMKEAAAKPPMSFITFRPSKDVVRAAGHLNLKVKTTNVRLFTQNGMEMTRATAVEVIGERDA